MPDVCTIPSEVAVQLPSPAVICGRSERSEYRAIRERLVEDLVPTEQVPRGRFPGCFPVRLKAKR